MHFGDSPVGEQLFSVEAAHLDLHETFDSPAPEDLGKILLFFTTKVSRNRVWVASAGEMPIILLFIRK